MGLAQVASPSVGPIVNQRSGGMVRKDKIVIKVLQRYWRVSRGLTMGVQGAVIDDQNRFLLIRHGYRPGWHFPGGGVEKNETLRTSLSRELEEEAAVFLTGEPELFGVYANFRNFPNDHVVVFLVRNWRQTHIPEPNAEIVEQGFFAADALPEGTVGGTRRRVNEIVHGAPRQDAW
jgi:ADP-ribose pyrophosphatase YjhB (NUDIX family)